MSRVRISDEKWVEIQRRKWLRNAKTDLQIKFGNDPLVAEFKMAWQKFMDWMNRGNNVSASEWGYVSLADTIITKSEYEYARDTFKESGEVWLLNTLKTLRRKYGKMKNLYYYDSN